MKTYHVHGVVTRLTTDVEFANVTVTFDAPDDANAQELAWTLFDDALYCFDVTEIEEA